MAHYIVQFTKAGLAQPEAMPDQARALLRIGMWGVPSTALLKEGIRPGDGLLVLVGAPHRVFVGDAVVQSGYHPWSAEEAARFPLAYDHGITLSRGRVWTHAIPVMAVWPHTVTANGNKKALFFGTFAKLPSDDAAIIVAAGQGAQPELADAGPRAAEHRVGSGAPDSETGPVGPRALRGGLSGRAEPPVGSTRDVAVRHGAGAGAVDHAARVQKIAQRLPWLPARIAHADWGTAPGKCVVSTAELDGGVYTAHAPRVVAQTGGLLERMHLTVGRRESTLLGFDFPIGVPRAYARSAGIENFAEWFRELDLDSRFFDVAADLAEVSAARPFFPKSIAEKTPGIKERFHVALGLSGADVLRRCDRAHCDRRAASEMFWALGPQAVGKAALAGWKHTLRPALAEPGRRYSIWPFDGTMHQLFDQSDAVIVETYPTEAYRQLRLRMGNPGSAKTRQADRGQDARQILNWCAENDVVADDALRAQLIDGFGPNAGGEDRFDAVVGLFGMIDTVRQRPEPVLPDDPDVRRVEGWIFGQHAECPEKPPSLASAGEHVTPLTVDMPLGPKSSELDEERSEILALLEKGFPSSHIARRLGIPVMRVAAIKAHVTMGTYAPEPTRGHEPVAGPRDPGEPVAPRAGNPVRAAVKVHRSDSAVQRTAETAILAAVAGHFGLAIAPRTLKLPGGARVEVDGAAADLSILVEVFARQGALKGGQQKKVCQDALKLITLGRSHPEALLVLAFADADAARYAATGTWVAEALATWKVQVLVVEISEEVRAGVRQAQVRQVMVNPPLADGDRDA